MTTDLGLTFQGDQQLYRRLKRLQGKEAVSALNTASRASLAPMLKLAKAKTPVVSGKLRDSLGIERRTDRRNAEINLGLGVRGRFTRKVEGGRMKLDARERDRANVHPILYAHFIEFGQTRDGSRRRRAGPAHMVSAAFQAEARNIPSHMRSALWKRLQKLAQQ